MTDIVIAILGGLIASSNLIISEKTNTNEVIDKLTLYQGWIGVALASWGVWSIMSSVLNIGNIGLSWIITLAVALIELVVGFLLGYGLISKYLLEKNEAAQEKGQALRLKLISYQIPAGLILFALGILLIVFFLIK